MKIDTIKKGLIILAIAMFAPFAMASATQSIARIVAQMNHFPSAAEKVTLMEISQDSSNSKSIQIIAMAVYNFKHSVKADDKKSLQMIAENADSSATEKELASIIAGISHTASAEAKAKLAALQ